MTLSPNLTQREFDKFEESPEGLTAVRVLPGTGWLSEAVGRKVTAAYPDGITEVYTYSDGVTDLFEITVTYLSSSKEKIDTVERTA